MLILSTSAGCITFLSLHISMLGGGKPSGVPGVGEHIFRFQADSTSLPCSFGRLILIGILVKVGLFLVIH